MTSRVLIVDDQESVTFNLERLFRRDGWSVRVASTTEQAMASLRDETFDLLVCDLRLGAAVDGDTGLTVVRKARELSSEIVIVVLTAYSSEQSVEIATRSGAQRVLSKPLRLKDLLAVVHELMAEPGPAQP